MLLYLYFILYLTFLFLQCRYWGEEEGETMNHQTREFFYKELGEPRVRFIDASKDFPWPAHHRQLFLSGLDQHKTGFVLKLAAAYLVPYQQVLYLDSDSAPLVSPDTLFDLKEYKKQGSLFWPDTPCQRPGLFNELIDMNLMGEDDAPAPGERESESGQWLLDRRLHREPLEYALLLGTHAEYTFTQAFGDKVSTFMLYLLVSPILISIYLEVNKFFISKPFLNEHTPISSLSFPGFISSWLRSRRQGEWVYVCPR